MTFPARSLGILLTLSALTCAAQTTCSRPAQQAAVARAKQLRRSLLAIPVVWLGDPIPDPVGDHLEQFKQALLRVADTTMACEPTSVSAAVAQQHLATLLHANLPPPPEQVISNADDLEKPEKDVITGGLEVRVKEALASPHLFAVTLDFGIPCGDDNILIVFEQTSNGWKDVLQWRKKNLPINNAVEAFGDFFEYAVLPGAGGDTWRLVALHGSPWCTSTISGFTMNLLAPSASPGSPKVLSSLEREYRRWNDPKVKFSAQGNTFTMRTDVDTGDPGLLMTRKAIFRYQLEGDHLRRIPPIATTGAFFVNEWLEMPWEEAQDFSEAKSAEALKAMHNRYTRKEVQTKPYVSHTFGPLRQCSDSPKHFQSEVDETPENGTTTPLFFSLLENGIGYTLLSSSLHPDPQCKGPNLMPKTQ